MIIAVIGVKALWLLFAWLLSAIVASYLSGRKGYGERIGLAFGLILAVLGAFVWIVWPAREGSDWKVLGPFGRPKVDEGIKDAPAGPAPSGPAGQAG